MEDGRVENMQKVRLYILDEVKLFIILIKLF